MGKVISLAMKDLRLMPRNRGGMFFTFVWPLIMTLMFGFAFGGQGDGQQAKPKIFIADEDATDASRAFVKKLETSFDVAALPRAEAEDAVRRGQRSAYIAIKKGFGAASDRLFYGASKEVELGVDPARTAEAGMIEGLLMKHAGEDMQKMFTDPAASTKMVDQALGEIKNDPTGESAAVAKFLGELKTFMNNPQAQAVGNAGGASDWQPLKIVKKDVAREQVGPKNAFEITFPQGVIWGLIGCVMTFGISLVTERTHGTLVRLRMAPLTRGQILGGKALACFTCIVIVQVMLFFVATAMGVHWTSIPLVILAGLSSAVCFVGFMMLIASLGKTEQTASGAAWAIMMPMSMLGGAMVPQFVLPSWMQTVGAISPVRWAILALEGGVWRNFSLSEMVLPCTILVSVGIMCFVVGIRGLKEA